MILAKQLRTHLRMFLRGSGRQVSTGGWLRLPERSKGDPAVKLAPYLPIYEELLAPLRGSRLTLLELGVWGGDSLQMWRDAFPKATIIGVDLGPPDIDLGPRVHIVEGDQADTALIASLRATYAPTGFDVIVDDASHLGITTARSLQALYPEYLRPGGLYCIEDWGTGYLPDWPDGDLLQVRLDRALLDVPASVAGAAEHSATTMPSHVQGMVGLVKRLVDHTARGSVAYGQPEQVGQTLEIDRMIIWDGIVALYKPRA
jgi:hypothetical protein